MSAQSSDSASWGNTPRAETANSDLPFIPLAVPTITDHEVARVTDAVKSGFVSSVGPYVAEFEHTFAELVGSKYAVACTSGTAAIHLAFAALDVPRGADIAVPDFTFVGSSNPVAYVGANALLVDSDRETWCLDQDLLIEALENRKRKGEALPAVVEPVHILGQPARIDRLVEFCLSNGIAIVEDAAESLGATWSDGAFAGRHTGTIGTIGAFSFNGNKIATAGGGGMLVTDDADLAARAKHLSTQAKVPDIGYLHDEVGYNYRLTNIAAALGLAQLDRLDELKARRAHVARRYDKAFAGTAITAPPRVPGFDATYWLYSVLAPAGIGTEYRDALWKHMGEAQIGSRPLWRPLHMQPPWQGSAQLGGAVAEDIFNRGLSLPCSYDLTDAEQDRVIDVALEFLSQLR
ncbi:aminotransferase class I/II-fold pyridoxal phosphate-dependent enzyme [Humibacter sp. RRB41]|uniref:aminotransferase class I/II-fold pyridoxal phosphate-dependent enzyme n=1 Tax=Humibacter sp. RRB41 TaxID=2919946 RepID=UPI001FAA8230|nr:aminotransferase class I/II-fold pyridoxal phosphate-dependent enzyme [Humibacter sp. RRB41]